MKKFRILFVTATAIVILLFGFNMIFYTPYIPMYRNSGYDHIFEKRPELLTPKHKVYMQVILKRNNEKFYIKSDLIYIKRTLSWNSDLLSNYTMKAIYMESEE